MESTENKNKAYTLVIRCGKAGGGKGALISEDVAMTLGCSNTQTLFQPIPLALRNRGGGKEVEWRTDSVANAITSVQTDSLVLIRSKE